MQEIPFAPAVPPTPRSTHFGNDNPGQIYKVTWRDLARPFGVLAMVALLVTGTGEWVVRNGVDLSQGGRNPDRVSMNWKRWAANAGHLEGPVVVSGDSSATTGIHPMDTSLGEWKEKILNLGLLIDLPLSVYAEALQEAVDARPGRVKAAVLMITPQRLGHQVTGDYFESLWKGTTDRHSQPRRWQAGKETWRSWPPLGWLERPLSGEGRMTYGFPSGIQRYLETYRGLFTDPGTYHARRSRSREVWQWHEALDDEWREFRSIWRGTVPLWLVLSPIPKSEAPEDYDITSRLWRDRLVVESGATGVLDELPAYLPDLMFASPTHLNQRGQTWFTHEFGRALSRRLNL